MIKTSGNLGPGAVIGAVVIASLFLLPPASPPLCWVIVIPGTLALLFALGRLAGKLSAREREAVSLAAVLDGARTEHESLKALYDEAKRRAGEAGEKLDGLVRERDAEKLRAAGLSETARGLLEKVRGVERVLEQGLEELDEADAPEEPRAEERDLDGFGPENFLRKIEDGGRSMKMLESKVSSGETRAVEAGSLLAEIAGEMEAINALVFTINKISAQTNMLSMNAAIESAHAGTAGAGFAVVAGEIKKLAESTEQNAKKMRTGIKAVTEKAKAGLAAGEASRRGIAELREEISRLAAFFAETAPPVRSAPRKAPAREQPDGIAAGRITACRERIRAALARIQAAETAASVEDAAAGPEQPSAAAVPENLDPLGVAVKEAPRTVP